MGDFCIGTDRGEVDTSPAIIIVVVTITTTERERDGRESGPESQRVIQSHGASSTGGGVRAPSFLSSVR
jgi:hypothetical protein